MAWRLRALPRTFPCHGSAPLPMRSTRLRPADTTTSSCALPRRCSRCTQRADNQSANGHEAGPASGPASLPLGSGAPRRGGTLSLPRRAAACCTAFASAQLGIDSSTTSIGCLNIIRRGRISFDPTAAAHCTAFASAPWSLQPPSWAPDEVGAIRLRFSIGAHQVRR